MKNHMGGCQTYGPFWGTLNIRCRIIIGIQKGTIVLTTTHMEEEMEMLWELGCCWGIRGIIALMIVLFCFYRIWYTVPRTNPRKTSVIICAPTAASTFQHGLSGELDEGAPFKVWRGVG